MNSLKQFILLISLLTITGCATVGPKIVIETPEPAEDFVVLCEWHAERLFSDGHGGRSLVGDKVFVTKSDAKVDCGINITGGAATANIYHPIYVGAVYVSEKTSESDMVYKKDGVIHVKMNKTKLDILDEQKAKFEAGYWDKQLNSGAAYARSLTGCGFPHQYFEYYSQVKKVNVEHFQSLYHEPLLKCMRRSFAVTKKYRPNASSQLPSADEWMRKMWESEIWGQWNENK